MRTIKFLTIILSLSVYLFTGALLRLFLAGARPHTRIKGLNRMKYYLMRWFALVAGLRIRVDGQKELLKKKGLFIISSHVGYIDGIVLGTLVPATFTTKKDIKKMPFIGRVVAVDGSIFISREERREILPAVEAMAGCLKNDINVVNFPEGHATDGTKILSFFPAFFDAPLKTKAPILPVTIDYTAVNGHPVANYDEIYCYDGKVPLLKHLWNLLRFHSIEAVVHIHESISPNGYRSDARGRKAFSDLCSRRLADYKKLPITEEHPLKRPSRPINA